ncbi:MAG: hypothetical protein E4H33_01770 [Anaerolineales bacterium]|nr:MAG: hypothetical protein E4H33_01770 [Anaerolineales bacterium]
MYTPPAEYFGKTIQSSLERQLIINFLAAFNKGISRGGYGPVVTAGQVLSGVRGRKAVGITSLTEGITRIVGVGIYLVSGITLYTPLLITLIGGAVLSVPLSAYFVSRLPAGKLTYIIGRFSTALGGYTLLKLLILCSIINTKKNSRSCQTAGSFSIILGNRLI